MCGEHQHDDTQVQDEALTGARFRVAEMTCDHCAGTIRKAFEQIMPGIPVAIDVGAREVTVTGDANTAAETIRAAGYEPQLVA
jgi:copper chaperone